MVLQVTRLDNNEENVNGTIKYNSSASRLSLVSIKFALEITG